MKYRITKDERRFNFRSRVFPFVVEQKHWLFGWVEETRFTEQSEAERYIEERFDALKNKIIKEY